jgi:hypothetical protein|tara:strand:+ start:319 stop:780 length:462 start_codon:yes stop_codon:yes gene_type:complete
MLAELAIINAAIGTIKTTIAHGHDLSKAAKSIAQFVTAEEDLRERANAKKNSVFSKLLGKDSNDFEEFMYLEEVEQKKQELREMLQLYGRPGVYNDWIKFQTEARKKRQQAKEEQKKAFEALIRNIMIALIVIIVVGGLLVVAWFAYFLKGQQ